MAVSFAPHLAHACVAPAHGGFAVLRVEGFGTTHTESLLGTVAEAHLIGDSNLVVLVGGGLRPDFAENEVRLYDLEKHEALVALQFPAPIRRVVVNLAFMAVLSTNSKVYLVDIASMKVLHTVDVCAHPLGLLALAFNPQRSFLAFPNSATAGEVTVYDVQKQAAVNIVKAHVGALAAVAVSSAGTLLATASDSGTLIRVFSLPDCSQVHTLRRGASPAHITALAFADFGSGPDTVLLVGSDSDTVHAFALSAQQPALLEHSVTAEPVVASEGGSGGLLGALSGLVSHATAAGAATVEGTRSFLRLHLAAAESRHVVGFAVATSSPGCALLTVVLSTGHAVQFSVQCEDEGGRVKLVGEHSLAAVFPPPTELEPAARILGSGEGGDGSAATGDGSG